MPACRILIVEDEALIAMDIQDMVEEMGYDVCGVASSASGAVTMARQLEPDVVLMDVRLRGPGDGVDAAQEIHAGRNVPIVYLTASGDQATVDRINQDHPASILPKPVRRQMLASVLDRLLRGGGG
ncbi:response regulator [Caenispirillum bisanense]|uniref:response regulator n=1 Tax=Caenispirillum bisanense TaxID=414052 RepID=UPI0031D1622B